MAKEPPVAAAPTPAADTKVPAAAPHACRNVELFAATAEDVICPMDGGVMTEPLLVPGCGHVVCSGCVNTAATAAGKSETPCPVCSKPFNVTAAAPAKDMKLKVLGLSAFCDHRSKGCTWEGNFAYLPDHLNECEHSAKLKCYFWMYGCDFTGTEEAVEHHLLDGAQHHLQLTCQRLESYGNNAEFALEPEAEPKVKDSGGLTDEQTELFVASIKNEEAPAAIATKFGEKYPDQAWSVMKCLRAECEQVIQSVGFAEVAYGHYLVTLVCGNRL